MVTSIINYINELSAGNQMIAGAISLWGMGTLTYFSRSIPVSTWSVIKRYFTTEMEINNGTYTYEIVTSWLHSQNLTYRKYQTDARVRALDVSTKKAGQGSHWFWYKKQLIHINVVRTEASNTLAIKESMYFTKLGRSHKLFNMLEKEAVAYALLMDSDRNKTKVFIPRDECWTYLTRQPIRSVDSVVIDAKIKEQLISSIQTFIDSEDWYIKHGIPYQLGILLYGPPGTGKTSLIRALAGHFKRDIGVMTAEQIGSAGDLLTSLTEDSFLALEDVDTCDQVACRDRGINKDEETFSRESTSLIKNKATTGLSNLLNALDGVTNNHGRILIMTTNHKEVLDPALLRPGRVDVMVNIDYMSLDCLRQMLSNFFEDWDKNLAGRIIKEKVTGALVQQSVRDKKSIEEIINLFTKEEKC